MQDQVPQQAQNDQPVQLAEVQQEQQIETKSPIQEYEEEQAKLQLEEEQQQQGGQPGNGKGILASLFGAN